MLKKLTMLEVWQEGKLSLPPGYGLEQDHDLMFLRRQDGTLAATFGVTGTAPSRVTRTAWEDHKFTCKDAF